MKKSKHHIIYTWIVLFCFAAGQVMVYAHQHIIRSAEHHVHKTVENQQTLTEKCQLCDAMHHNTMLVQHQQCFSPIVAANHFYTPGKYDFISIALILSAGRSPPLSS